jgi:hypothetical protein
MVTVADLKFEKGGLDIERARVMFPNGYGASVIQGPMAFWNWCPGLFELAVLDAAGELSYDTPITGDVERGDVDDINAMLAAIEALPAKASLEVP